MVLGRKTNFFLGKTKKTIFLEFGRIVSQKMVFLEEKVGFSVQNHLGKSWFFLPKTIFFPVFLGKSWFSCPKPSFSQEKVGFPVQNHFFP